MRLSFAIAILVAVLVGCSAGPSGVLPPGQFAMVFYDNPSLIPLASYDYVWETVADVVDDYFRIEREEPVRLIGNTLTEGRIDTFPEVSPTVFEPWRPDVANGDQRVENTLQSMRRQATVRVIPAQGGFWVEVTVLKFLEDVMGRPEFSTAGAATLRSDTTLTRVINPLVGPAIGSNWIPQGRDTALEQRMLDNLHVRFGAFAPPAMPISQPGPLLLPTAPPAPVGTFSTPAPAAQQCLRPISPVSSSQPTDTSEASGSQRTCFPSLTGLYR